MWLEKKLENEAFMRHNGFLFLIAYYISYALHVIIVYERTKICASGRACLGFLFF